MTDTPRRHEVLANWIRLCLWPNTPTSIEDRIRLTDLLARLGILPEHGWETVDVALIDHDVVGCCYLAATVRAIIRRNEHLAEVLRNWEWWHGTSFEQVVVENG